MACNLARHCALVALMVVKLCDGLFAAFLRTERYRGTDPELGWQGPSEQAQTVLTEALESAEALGDLRAQLRVLLDLASVTGFRGEYARAAAREQGALFWELRVALSLARLLRGQGRSADAMGILQPVYDRFTEGFATADLEQAKNLLEQLALAD